MMERSLCRSKIFLLSAQMTIASSLSSSAEATAGCLSKWTRNAAARAMDPSQNDQWNDTAKTLPGPRATGMMKTVPMMRRRLEVWPRNATASTWVYRKGPTSNNLSSSCHHLCLLLCDGDVNLPSTYLWTQIGLVFTRVLTTFSIVRSNLS